jgi:hypothetical protein
MESVVYYYVNTSLSFYPTVGQIIPICILLSYLFMIPDHISSSS